MGFNLNVETGHAVLLKNLIEFVRDKIPREFMPEEIVQIEYQLNQMLDRGCFKHGELCTIFTDIKVDGVSYTSSTTICKQCDPKRYNQYLKRVEEGIATMEE